DAGVAVSEFPASLTEPIADQPGLAGRCPVELGVIRDKDAEPARLALAEYAVLELLTVRQQPPQAVFHCRHPRLPELVVHQILEEPRPRTRHRGDAAAPLDRRPERHPGLVGMLPERHLVGQHRGERMLPGLLLALAERHDLRAA